MSLLTVDVPSLTPKLYTSASKSRKYAFNCTYLKIILKSKYCIDINTIGFPKTLQCLAKYFYWDINQYKRVNQKLKRYVRTKNLPKLASLSKLTKKVTINLEAKSPMEIPEELHNSTAKVRQSMNY